MIRIKICGICDLEGARTAAEAGADMIGFHFCDSDRRISPDDARAILDEMPVRPKVVGVFIDEEAGEVRRIGDLLDLDFVQLHGSEPAGFMAGRPVIKVLKVKDGVIAGADDWPDPIMLDSWSADQRGGTGRTWDWGVARTLLETRSVFIAGGLEPGNVGKVVTQFKPYGVDVSSGVEARVRVKDPEKVRAFIRAVRVAEAIA
ncbi:MAG TPA: phosphoribosylanthranilate isomerase [Candidatus Dormibacteraeota bacterium]|jgi:phosphoribosylanthranilate isomerase|nr:phosphoribosylanthranilate isomerase [Candidatus Dormibacteraeota bacterium]